MITDGGVLIRTPAAGISMQGRNTQGIRVIALSDKERLVTVDRVDEDQSEEALPEQEAPEQGTTENTSADTDVEISAEQAEIKPEFESENEND